MPSQAFGSWNPRTIKRAFARGLPSGFFDPLSNILLDNVRLGSASRVVSRTNSVVKETLQSLTLAALN